MPQCIPAKKWHQHDATRRPDGLACNDGFIADGPAVVSDLQWVSANSGWTPNNDGLPRLDTDVEGNSLRLGGRKYRKGIGTHAPSEITYKLQKQYDRFTAMIGCAEANGTVLFKIFGDGKLLFSSSQMRGLREVQQVDIPLENIDVLMLQVTDAGDSNTSDMANWADARLQKISKYTAR